MLPPLRRSRIPLRSVCLQVLGYLVIASVIVAQVPQIIKIVHHHSVEGISLASLILIIEASSASVAYALVKKFPFSTWGETLILLVQNLVRSCLVLWYQQSPRVIAAFLLVYAASFTCLLWPLVPWSFTVFLKAANLPVISASKSLQIYTNFRNGSTGQLSFMSVMIMNFRSISRIITSVIETDDLLLIGSFAMVAVWNSIIAVQMMYYKKRKMVKKVE